MRTLFNIIAGFCVFACLGSAITAPEVAGLKVAETGTYLGGACFFAVVAAGANYFWRR